jgi:hypothetical protein
MLALPNADHPAHTMFDIEHLIEMTHPGTTTPAPRMSDAMIEAKRIMDGCTAIQSMTYIVRVNVADVETIHLVEIIREGNVKWWWRFTMD